ncbi:MAG: DUF1415 domain-containing protein [Gammaproteobacteria bacterium]|jgi:hypothetical protein|nr:DUF1415 domain-containing protein [Gammaproteobacteria bacterium]
MLTFHAEPVAEAVRHWLESVVIGLNLCPFARRELAAERVRFAVTPAATEAGLLEALRDELELLEHDSRIETTLLIHPAVLQSFADYNQFLNAADSLLAGMQLEGVIQVASFHPDYQFAGTGPDDAENFTNRSPYPLLHLLREASVERAIDALPEVAQIPLRNVELMNQMGRDALQDLVRSCCAGVPTGDRQ